MQRKQTEEISAKPKFIQGSTSSNFLINAENNFKQWTPKVSPMKDASESEQSNSSICAQQEDERRSFCTKIDRNKSLKHNEHVTEEGSSSMVSTDKNQQNVKNLLPDLLYTNRRDLDHLEDDGDDSDSIIKVIFV